MNIRTKPCHNKTLRRQKFTKNALGERYVRNFDKKNRLTPTKTCARHKLTYKFTKIAQVGDKVTKKVWNALGKNVGPPLSHPPIQYNLVTYQYITPTKPHTIQNRVVTFRSCSPPIPYKTITHTTQKRRVICAKNG